ncbi:MAG: glycosyltransferase family 2 protein, partial [Lentisphaeria bacterium]|nr:glycosyltransferase family 2 protein [Lentisphaeria bacterium]
MTDNIPLPDYTIIIPVYYNEGTLVSTVAAIRKEVIARNPGRVAEILFIDDGSGDGSLDELLQLHKDHPGLVRVIKLTRNFGQVNAMLAGYAQARGKCVVAMSADGQDPPSLINEMLAAHFDEGHEVVICSRVGRDESAYRVLTSKLFYALMRRLAFPNMPSGGFDYMLLGRRALDVLLRNQEAHLFLQGHILWLGFKPKFLEYHRRKREVGSSRWTFGRKLTYLIDGLMSCSFVPIRLVSLTGM